jgi:hypothetical protein
MGLVRQLMLPSAETVEKMSYGDPMFRMPTQSNIPITADKEYLADVAGMIPFGAPAARPTARGIQDLVRQIQTTPPTGAVTLQGKPSIQNLLPETEDEISAIADEIAEQAKAAGFRVRPGYSNVSGSQYVTIEKPIGENEFKAVQVRVSNHGDRYPGTAEGTRFSIDPSSRNTYENAIGFLADEGFDITKPIVKEALTFEQYVRNLGLDPNLLTPEQLDTLQFTARREGISVGGLLDEPAQNVEKIYHGTSPQAARQIEQAGFDINKSADGTVWFTSNPEIGEVAATGKGAVVERLIDLNKLKLGGWKEADKFGTDELLSKGFDGLRLEGDGQVTYQIFNPEKLQKAIK